MERKKSKSNASEYLYGRLGDGKYPLLKKIDKGMTSSVYESRINFGNSKELKTAIKVINLDRRKKDLEKFVNFFRNEAQLLSKIDSTNILKVYDEGHYTIKKNEEVYPIEYLVLEFAENGNLLNYISELNEGFGEEKGHSIFVQILKGVYDCHKNGICHRDLKLENIMLDDCFRIKLGDFGFAKQLDHNSSKVNTPLGTPGYAPPEIIMNKPYDGYKADIFSLGICLFGLVFGRHPFISMQKNIDYRQYAAVTQNDGVNQFIDIYWKNTKEIGINPSNEFKDLFIKMISQNPEKRPSVSEIIGHPWVNKPTISLAELQQEFHRRKCQIESIRQEKELLAAEDEDYDDAVYRGSLSIDYNYFDNFSRIYTDEYKFLPEYGLLIKTKPSKPWELFNQITNKLGKYIEEPKEISCINRGKLKFRIDFLLKPEEYLKISKEDTNEEEEEEEDEEESISSKDEQKIIEKKEIDENRYLSLEIRYNFDEDENIEFINFTKVFGSTFEFYQKIKAIKKILV